MNDLPEINPPNGQSDDAGQMQTATVTVSNPMGLHLRTGKDVVRIASQFEAEITARNLTRSSLTVDVKSILQLMQLQAHKGHTLLFCASGPDAHDALKALISLF